MSDVCVCVVTVRGSRLRAEADVCERGSELWHYHRVPLSGFRER